MDKRDVLHHTALFFTNRPGVPSAPALKLAGAARGGGLESMDAMATALGAPLQRISTHPTTV